MLTRPVDDHTINPMPRMLVLVLLALMLGAPVVAAANIPDPTWIPGLYDGGDGDEALLLVWDNAPAMAPAEPAWVTSLAALLSTVEGPLRVSFRRPSASASRAPPLA